MKTKTYNIVKMYFSTPLHLSRGQTDAYDKSEEILHSDTIKSAIFVCAKMLFGDEIDKNFFESFHVSSAFPFKKDEYFFPKPMAKLNLNFENIDSENEISKLSKNLKKLNFISKDIFEKVISGDKYLIKKTQLSKNKKFVFSDENLLENDKIVYKSEVQQRLKVEIGEDGTPYYIDRIYFTENSGLYFFIEYLDNSDKEKINAAVKLLGDEGVGTDKHIGNGAFKPNFVDLDLNLSENANSKMLLSLYCPQKYELKNGVLQKSSYSLIKRGGYIASPANIQHLTYRKKSVYMFAEASVFPKEMKLQGKTVDLQPNVNIGQSIWRDGFAFSIPFSKTNED